jgi:dTDP-glucose pyrophosphorylase
MTGIILSAAKADVTICEVFGNLPSGLIPVNGRPVIFYILQQFLDAGIDIVYVGVDYKCDKIIEAVDLHFASKLRINYVHTDGLKGVGNSLLRILEEVDSCKVVICLGDTYIKGICIGDLSDEFVISGDYIEEERWATVELNSDRSVKCFRDKIASNVAGQYALTGMYILDNIKLLRDFYPEGDNLQIVDILDFYRSRCASLRGVETNHWMDFGHIDKFYVSKKRMIQSREFNSLEFDDLLGTITKRSHNIEKLRAEIEWQLNLTDDLRVLAPRILSHSVGSDAFVKMEFYSYPTLSEIWLFSELHEKVYFSIITKLFAILDLFKSKKRPVSIEDYSDVYLGKTLHRIAQIENEKIQSLLMQEFLLVNNRSLANWHVLEQEVTKEIYNLYCLSDNCVLHGDFCLSNILYDLRSGVVRLLDPRGSWGSSANGDIKYDVAKLRHSICSDYDYMVNDLFCISTFGNEVRYKISNSSKAKVKHYFDKTVSASYDLNQIKLIEGLLFIGMIPLHSDNTNRQLMMYVRGVELLNDALSEGSLV